MIDKTFVSDFQILIDVWLVQFNEVSGNEDILLFKHSSKLYTEYLLSKL